MHIPVHAVDWRLSCPKRFVYNNSLPCADCFSSGFQNQSRCFDRSIYCFSSGFVENTFNCACFKEKTCSLS